MWAGILNFAVSVVRVLEGREGFPDTGRIYSVKEPSMGTIHQPIESNARLYLPHLESLCRAGISGFPSPAQDYEGRKLDLNEFFVSRPSASFYITAVGDSMREYGIFDGTLLLVDRSLDLAVDDVVVGVVDGELIVKSYEIRHGRKMLCSGADRYPPVPAEAVEDDTWGVVSSIHRRMRVLKRVSR